jgi:hypothetical protein
VYRIYELFSHGGPKFVLYKLRKALRNSFLLHSLW